MIENIVDEIVRILGHKSSSLPKDLVGMKSNLRELEKHLRLDLVDDVLAVGICGMRGIGKTTLAAVLSDKISHEFDVNCVIDDLSKIYREDGAIGVQKQIICQTLGKEYLEACNIPYKAVNLIQRRLHNLKILIIFDNVDHVEQVETLGVNWDCLNAGSRIIIISRCEDIFRECGVDAIYKVPLLNWTKSLKLLLCQKAFKRDHIMSDYDHLACEMLCYTNVLPMAIKILGSFLFDRNVTEWKSALTILKKSPNRDIMDVLGLSFDGLEEMMETLSQKKVSKMMEHSVKESYHDPMSLMHVFNDELHVFNDENIHACNIM